MDPIKIGLIGFGRMGGFYLDEMLKSGKWEIAYVCDPAHKSYPTNSSSSTIPKCR